LSLKEIIKMPQVLVRDLDPLIIDRLKSRAKQNGRSLEAELRLILQTAAEDGPADPLAAVERVRAMFADRRFSDSAELIREDRER
jgi:antitoxin FitA